MNQVSMSLLPMKSIWKLSSWWKISNSKKPWITFSKPRLSMRKSKSSNQPLKLWFMPKRSVKLQLSSANAVQGSQLLMKWPWMLKSLSHCKTKSNKQMLTKWLKRLVKRSSLMVESFPWSLQNCTKHLPRSIKFFHRSRTYRVTKTWMVSISKLVTYLMKL